ncbi:MAG: phenylacetate--CoA ligase family protein [Firmicutes bacterium]|nr:phenylacetate--CoA ligase family protein [Bacillota bacterium]
MVIGGDVQSINGILEYARKAPFYQGRLPARSLTSVSELTSIPLTTKADLRDYSPFGLLAVPKSETAVYFESFGTTGKPVSIWLTEEDLDDNADVVSMMRSLEVTVLAALPLQALLLARTAELVGLSRGEDFPHLRAICTAGETLTPRRREVIQELWQVPVFDNYGMTEVGAAAMECPFGKLHPLVDHFAFEVLDEDRTTPVELGELGYLVITTLKRRATPIIRYWTGDRVRLFQESCPCGAGYRLEVRGRRESCLQVGDRLFDLWDLEEMVDGISAKGLWAAGPLEPWGLHFVVESDQLDHNDLGKRIGALEELYQIPLQFTLVPPGTFYDPEELLSIGEVGKPRYIFSAEELKLKAYQKSLRL